MADEPDADPDELVDLEGLDVEGLTAFHASEEPTKRGDRRTPYERFKRDWITHFVLVSDDGKWLSNIDPDRVLETANACRKAGRGYVRRVDWIRTFYE